MADTLGALIVTGASRGIGAAVALAAADAGYAVAVNYVHNEVAAKRVVDQVHRRGGEACAIGADIGRESDIIRGRGYLVIVASRFLCHWNDFGDRRR
ncbi:MAG: SDR family NAD(P)-dependent oxidoreductase, partial [Chthoniobacterales bacterium]